MDKTQIESLTNLRIQKDQEYAELLKKYDNLGKEFEDLKSDRKRVSLEQQIIDLKNQLKEAKKPWWKKVSNNLGPH